MAWCINRHRRKRGRGGQAGRRMTSVGWVVSALFSPLTGNLLAFSASSPLTVVPLECLILVWKVWVWCVSSQVSRLDLHTPTSWRKGPVQWQGHWLFLATCRQHIHCRMPFYPRADFLAAVAISAQLKQPYTPTPKRARAHTHTHTQTHSPLSSQRWAPVHPIVLWDPGRRAHDWERRAALSVSA